MFIARERGVEDRGYDRAALLAYCRHGLQCIVAKTILDRCRRSRPSTPCCTTDALPGDRAGAGRGNAGSSTALRVLRYLGPMDSRRRC
jgi:hypothetical protein